MRSTHIGRGKRPYSKIVMMTIVSFGVACFLFPHLFHRVVASAELFETDLQPQGHHDNSIIELSTSDALAVDGKDCEIDDCELEDPVIGIYLLAETEEYLRFGDAEKTNNIELRDGLIYKLVNISEEWIKTQESLLISGEDPIKIPAGSIVKNATIDLGEKEPEILPRDTTFVPTPAPIAIACEDKKWFYVKDANTKDVGNCSNGDAPHKISYDSAEECCGSDAFQQPFDGGLCMQDAIDVCKPNPYPNTSYPSPAPTCDERKWYVFSSTCSNQYELEDLLYDSIKDCCARECPSFCGNYDDYDGDDELFYYFNLCEEYSAGADVCSPKNPPSPSSPSPPVNWPTFSPTTSNWPTLVTELSPTYIPESYEPTYEQTTSNWPTQAASKTSKEPVQPASYEPTGSAYATPTLLSKVPTAKPTHFAPLKLSMKPSTMSPSNARRNLKKNKRQLQTGTKTVLAVRVVTADGVYNFTEAVLSDKVFGTAGDPVNLKSQYDICSYGQLKFAPTPGRELLSDPEDQTTNIVDGVMTVEIAVNASRLGWIEGITENAITAKINKVFGVTSPKEIADHVMYCLPDHGPFFMAAKGYINSWSSVYNNENCNFVSVQMHEIGHNLRYAHSSEAGMTYADETGMMGYSDELDDWPAKCFNAAKSWQTGWYKSKQAVVIPSATDGDECFEDEMFGIGDFDNPAAQNLLVKISDPNNNNYYITFNTKSSVNAGVRKALDLVTITRSSFENGYQRGESASHLVAKLGSGEQYSTEIDGKEMIVKVSNIGPSSARVIVSQNGEGCQKKPCDCSCSSTSSAKSSKSANSSAKSDKKSSAKSAKKSQDKSSNKSSSKENKKKRKGKSKGKKKKDKKSGSKSARRALQACDCDCDNKSTNVKPDDTDRVPGLKPTAPPQSTAFPTFDFSEPTCTRQKYHSCCRAKSGDLSWLEDKNPPKIYEECMAGIFTATQYCNECLKPCDINGCPKSFSEPTCLKPMYDECCKAKARGRLPWSPANKPPAIYEECMGQTFTPTQYCENCLNPCKINDCPKIYSEPTCTKSMRKECCRANSQGLPWLNDETPPSPLQECMDGIFTVAQYCNSCGYPCKIDDCLPKDEASVDEDNVEGVLTIEGSTDSAFVEHENSELHHTTTPTGNLFD